MWRAALVALLVLACAKPEVTRDDWQRMKSGEKALFIESLIGAEKVKQRKEGKIRKATREPAEYVREIDAAYARGDQRSPQAIFDDASR